MRYVTVLHGGVPRAGAVAGDAVRLFAGVADLAAYVALDAAARAAVAYEVEIPLAGATLLAPLRPHKNVVLRRPQLQAAHRGRRARARHRWASRGAGVLFQAALHRDRHGDESSGTAASPRVRLRDRARGSSIGTRSATLPRTTRCRRRVRLHRLNDITARDLQRDHLQWFKGKSLDDLCPIGPWIVGAEEIGDPQRLEIELRVNGVVKQHSNTANMIFDVRRIVASLSRGMTLEPGDVIATGTPEGVGMARTPPEFFADGDVVEVEIERIGVLRNRIALRPAARG